VTSPALTEEALDLGRQNQPLVAHQSRLQTALPGGAAQAIGLDAKLAGGFL
jgi:hypothetical protein